MKYKLKEIFGKIDLALRYCMTAYLFIVLIPLILYVSWFLFIAFDFYRVIAGVVTIYIVVYLSKSL